VSHSWLMLGQGGEDGREGRVGGLDGMEGTGGLQEADHRWIKHSRSRGDGGPVPSRKGLVKVRKKLKIKGLGTIFDLRDRKI